MQPATICITEAATVIAVMFCFSRGLMQGPDERPRPGDEAMDGGRQGDVMGSPLYSLLLSVGQQQAAWLHEARQLSP